MVWPTLGSRTAKEQNRTEHFSRVRCRQRRHSTKMAAYGQLTGLLADLHWWSVDFFVGAYSFRYYRS